jgi:hypothetical protein
MDLILHTGVHYTEEERLLKSLLRNASTLQQRGVAVPGPSTYRALIRDTLNAMHKTPAAPQAREVLMDAFLDDAKYQRVVLSDANFFRTQGTALMGGVLYPHASVRMMRMAQLFSEDRIEIFMGLRNPATLIPILYGQAQKRDPLAFWGRKQPIDVKWSETIAMIREATPEIPITVWCNEDTPLVWGDVLRAMGGLDPDEKIAGGFDLLATIMSKEGMQRFRAYLEKHPNLSQLQRRKVIAAFLDKFALDGAIEEELDMPGWDDALVDQMTDAYDADMEVVANIPGVRFIMP